MIDDFGDLVVTCRYTQVLLWPDETAVIGATIPGVKTRYYMARTDEAKALHRENGIAFHESEANCNTCSMLERVKRPKGKDGFLYGSCKSKSPRFDKNPYKTDDGFIKFHPDDWMGMPCYVSRWEALK